MARGMVDMYSNKKNLLIEFDGQMLTRKEIAKHPKCQVSYPTLCKKLEDGLPIERAVINESMKPKVITYKGKQMTISEVVALPECKIGRNLLAKRIREGMTPEEAVAKPKRVRKPRRSEQEEEIFSKPSVDAVAEGRMTQEERDYWDEWLATPVKVILKRCEEYWDGKAMKEVETVGQDYHRGR